MNPNQSKETIYIDIDDEITSVIDKVTSSKSDLIALVLPKRASVFQSIVNMKLLKKKAEQAKKTVVLVTTETGLLPLAGATGIYVAKTLSSKPEIPDAPIKASAIVDASEEEPIQIGKEPSKDLDKSVGELDEQAKQSPNKLDKEVEDINLEELEDEPKPTKKEKKEDKSKKVPNFDKFKKYALFGGIGLVTLIFLFWVIFSVLPSATITISTNAQNVNTNVNLNLSTTATSLNTKNNTVPAKQVTESKNYTASANATGQQNNGQKASGTVTLTEKVCVGPPVDVPAGTGITQSGVTYITQSNTTFNHNGTTDGTCNTYTSTKNTAILAQNPGTKYNSSNLSLTSTINSTTTISGNGSASGGTDNIITVVSQSDINNATNKISANNNSVKQELTNQLQSLNYYAIGATFTSSAPNPSPSVAAGTQASSVTVSETINYSMYGARSSDLNTLLTNNINSQANGQKILDTGLSNATFQVGSTSDTQVQLTMQTTAEVGPSININELKKQVAGQKSGSIKSIIQSDPNVTNVVVKFSPFYVSQAPSKQSKINIIVAKPTKSLN